MRRAALTLAVTVSTATRAQEPDLASYRAGVFGRHVRNTYQPKPLKPWSFGLRKLEDLAQFVDRGFRHRHERAERAGEQQRFGGGFQHFEPVEGL